MRSIAELEEALKDATSVQDTLVVLEALFSGGYNVLPSGELYYIKELVARVNGLRIYVYANDHPPPHFHVLGGGIDATFRIDDCTRMAGDIDPRRQGLLRWWHSKAHQHLVDAWKRNQIDPHRPVA